MNNEDLVASDNNSSNTACDAPFKTCNSIEQLKSKSMKGNEITLEQKKVKAAFCYCEKGIFYVAALPYAETEKECIRNFARYARQGHRIDYVSTEEMKEKFYKCDCYKSKKKESQPELFAQ